MNIIKRIYAYIKIRRTARILRLAAASVNEDIIVCCCPAIVCSGYLLDETVRVKDVFTEVYHKDSCALYGPCGKSAAWFYNHNHADVLEAMTRRENDYYKETREHRVVALLLLADAIQSGDIPI